MFWDATIVLAQSEDLDLNMGHILRVPHGFLEFDGIRVRNGRGPPKNP